jgi:NH3-dependent NAD+ synthetase
MITVNMKEIELKNKVNALDRELRNKFITKEITETEFKKRHRIISLYKVYNKLNLIKFL